MRLVWLITAALLLSNLGHAAGLRIYVFDGDGGHAPMAGVTLEIDGQQKGQTNQDGRIFLEQKPGKFSLRLFTPARSASISDVVTIEGEVTEVIVTLHIDLDALVSIEQRKVTQPTKAEETISAFGTIEGRCVTKSGKPLRGVQVFVLGQSATATTNSKGEYKLRVGVGKTALSFIRSGYRNARADALDVSKDQSQKLDDIVMDVANPELEEFVVTAPYIEGGVAALVSERRETSNVVDVIGAEQMAQTGDSSAASALKRVTGLTIVGGKYIYVRGMGERYSSTTLNGMFLPSPEPERRVVPLDMFPTGILSSVVVQKTYSSDQTGEFGGGVVQLRTKRLPESSFLEASISMGGRTGSTFTDGLTYEGGDYDYLGIDSGARALPANVAAETNRTALKLCSIANRDNCLSPDELTELGRAFPNTYNSHRTQVPLDFGGSVSGGYLNDQGRIKFGGVASIQYDQGWNRQQMTRNTFRVSAGQLEVSDGGRIDSLTRTIQASGILELGLDIGRNHKIATTSLLLRNTDDEASQFVGTNADERSDVIVRRLRWVERELFTQQVRGEHDLPNLELKWNYGLSLADRLEPNRRISQYDRSIGTDNPFGLSAKPEGNRRFFSDLDDTAHEVRASARYLLSEAKAGRAKSYVEVGGATLNRERIVETRRYKFQGPAGQVESLDVLFARDRIGNEQGQYRLLNTTQTTDDYKAIQKVYAGYLASEIGLLNRFRVMGGVRLENAEQNVSTFSPFTGDDPVSAKLKNFDLLPSTSTTWVLTESMQLRAGYGRTVSRPEFRELSPARFDDVTNRQSVVGNPDLKRALIDHYDLRWELYFNARDSISIAGFFKYFTDPIETKISCGADKTLTFRNSPSAQNLGAELAWRKGFEFLGLDRTFFSGNVSIIDSNVELGQSDGCETSSRRPLEGQSAYVINLQLGYEAPRSLWQWSLLYNVSGRRIVEVGTSSLPDVYEQPRNLVDFVLGMRLGAGFALKLKAKNLIDQAVERRAGPLIQSRGIVGRSVSLGLKYEH